MSHNFIAKNFLMHWTWISHLPKDNEDTNHTNGIYIHTSEDWTITNPGEVWPICSPKQTFSQYKWSLMSDVHPNQMAKKPKWHSVITNGPQWHTDIRSYWQTAQIAPSCSQMFPHIGTPLQYSCLENPMDGGTWKAAVHGVAKSRTRLRDFTFTFMHWRRKWQPTPVFLPGESQGQGSLVGCRLWGRTESDTTEVT